MLAKTDAREQHNQNSFIRYLSPPGGRKDGGIRKEEVKAYFSQVTASNLLRRSVLSSVSPLFSAMADIGDDGASTPATPGSPLFGGHKAAPAADGWRSLLSHRNCFQVKPWTIDDDSPSPLTSLSIVRKVSFPIPFPFNKTVTFLPDNLEIFGRRLCHICFSC